MVTIRNIIYTLILVIIGLISFISVITINSLNSFSQKDYQVKFNQFAAVFYSADLSSEVFKISPLDDYVYTNTSKNHVIPESDFNKAKDITNSFWNKIQVLLFHQSRIIWQAEGKNKVKVTYEMTEQPNSSVKITRKFSNLNPDTYAIGQSIVLCKDCFVTDQIKRVYFNSSDYSQERIRLADSYHLIPILLTDNVLPNDVSRIIIIDTNFNLRFIIPTQPGQQIFYDQKWSLLELKTPVNKRLLETSQIINFKNVE